MKRKPVETDSLAQNPYAVSTVEPKTEPIPPARAWWRHVIDAVWAVAVISAITLGWCVLGAAVISGNLYLASAGLILITVITTVEVRRWAKRSR
jgi:hypothetical protein